MTINITVEDGTIVSGANSFVDTAYVLDYAISRGVDLSATDIEIVKSYMLKAADFFLIYDKRWKGDPVVYSQSMPWPRNYVNVRGLEDYYPNNEIPDLVKRAQSQLVLEQSNGIELFITTAPGLPVIKEKIDVIETTYASPVDLCCLDFNQPIIPIINAILAPLLNSGFRLTSKRI
jgi:hypothetical protein